MSKSEVVVGGLSIGELAERTGVSAATLRVWESRHGFPVPRRRESGHRRYDLDQVDLVRDVARRRDEGVRLDVAISHATSAQRPPAHPPGSPSVFARLRHTHPALTPHRLSKTTLLGLSWAIEDEFASRAQYADLFGAFQRSEHYRSAEVRWTDLARTMSSTFVFADFDPGGTGTVAGGQPVPVALPPDHPMSREWAVVCDGDSLSFALTAWELPGQAAVRDRDRIFETVWTVEQGAVREAARVCARVAADLGATGADAVADRLDGPLGSRQADLAQVTSLFNRVVAYVDARLTRRP